MNINIDANEIICIKNEIITIIMLMDAILT